MVRPEIPPTPRREIWTSDKRDELSDFIEDEVWRALHEYLWDDGTFVYVEGNEISVHVSDHAVTRHFPLKDALMWNVDGFTGRDGKIEPVDDVKPEHRSGHAAGIANLRQLRAILADVIAEIDAALPDEQDSALGGRLER